MLRNLLLSACLGLTALPVMADEAQSFDFMLIGDMPYGAPEKVDPLFEALIDQINAAGPDLVVHVGDTKSGSTPCSDEMLDKLLGYMNRFTAPVLYSLGDNEWTDCYRPKAGDFDPLDRLARIRDSYFADPATSLGANPVAVETQADAGYPENARLMHKGVMFITAHVPGSNNNFEIRDPKAVEEFFARDAANNDWLKAGFAAAAEASAVVVAIQADMFEFDFNEFGKETFLRHSGFGNFAETLIAESNAFGKPVLLVYGDSHIFRVWRPFPKRAPMITGIETFGEDDMDGVQISFDPAASFPFSARPFINAAAPLEPARDE